MINDLTVPAALVMEEANFVEGYRKISEVAKMLGVSSKTVTRWIHKGRFFGVIKNDPDAETGTYYMIPDSAIEAFMERRKNTTVKKDEPEG